MDCAHAFKINTACILLICTKYNNSIKKGKDIVYLPLQPKFIKLIHNYDHQHFSTKIIIVVYYKGECTHSIQTQRVACVTNP